MVPFYSHLHRSNVDNILDSGTPTLISFSDSGTPTSTKVTSTIGVGVGSAVGTLLLIILIVCVCLHFRQKQNSFLPKASESGMYICIFCSVTHVCPNLPEQLRPPRRTLKRTLKLITGKKSAITSIPVTLSQKNGTSFFDCEKEIQGLLK